MANAYSLIAVLREQVGDLTCVLTSWVLLGVEACNGHSRKVSRVERSAAVEPPNSAKVKPARHQVVGSGQHLFVKHVEVQVNPIRRADMVEHLLGHGRRHLP